MITKEKINSIHELMELNIISTTEYVKILYFILSLPDESGSEWSKDETYIVNTTLAVINEVAQYYNISGEQLISKDRNENSQNARQLVMYICKKNYGLSLDIIGKAVGNRDKFTVIHEIHEITQKMEYNQNFKEEVECLTEKIKRNLELYNYINEKNPLP